MEIETHFKIEQMESSNGSGALAKLLCWFKKSKIKPRIRRDINLEQSIDNGNELFVIEVIIFLWYWEFIKLLFYGFKF